MSEHQRRLLELLSDGEPHSHHEVYALRIIGHSRVADLRRKGYKIKVWREVDPRTGETTYLYQLVSLPGPAASVHTPVAGPGSEVVKPASGPGQSSARAPSDSGEAAAAYFPPAASPAPQGTEALPPPGQTPEQLSLEAA